MRAARLSVKALIIDVVTTVGALAIAIVAPKQGTALALGGPWLCLTYSGVGGRCVTVVRAVRLAVKAVVVDVVTVVVVSAIAMTD